jgi:hypothetical protein
MKRLVMMTALACLALPTVVVADSKEIDQQIVGAWKLDFTAPDGVRRTPIVVVGRQYQKYVAWYVEKDQPEPFQNVQLRDDLLVGTISPQERPDITVTLESRLAAPDRCTGTARYRSKDGSDSGSWNFTGQRVNPSSFDEVMTWKLSFTTPDYQQHSPTITVVSQGDKLYAWYSGKDHELPATAISVDGNRVEMKISAVSPEGSPIDVTFRGTVNGDEVSGNAEFRMPGDSGGFAFKGKRAS